MIGLTQSQTNEMLSAMTLEARGEFMRRCYKQFNLELAALGIEEFTFKGEKISKEDILKGMMEGKLVLRNLAGIIYQIVEVPE